MGDRLWAGRMRAAAAAAVAQDHQVQRRQRQRQRQWRRHRQWQPQRHQPHAQVSCCCCFCSTEHRSSAVPAPADARWSAETAGTMAAVPARLQRAVGGGGEGGTVGDEAGSCRPAPALRQALEPGPHLHAAAAAAAAARARRWRRRRWAVGGGCCHSHARAEIIAPHSARARARLTKTPKQCIGFADQVHTRDQCDRCQATCEHVVAARL